MKSGIEDEIQYRAGQYSASASAELKKKLQAEEKESKGDATK